MSIYQADLAHVHHVGFGDFARGAAPGVLKLLHDAGIDDGLIVDLGCGSGIWAAELTAAGYSVVGVDRSADMLALAKKNAPQATFVHQSLWTHPIPRCRAVTALGEGLNYVDTAVSRHAPGELFEKVATALDAGGLFVFDIMMRSRAKPMAYQSWREGEGWSVLIDVREQPEERLLTRRIVTFRKSGELYARSEETHYVQLFTRKEIERALAAHGFSVRAMHRYGTYNLAPQRLAFVARKK